LHEQRDRRRVREVFDKEDRRLRDEHSRGRLVQLTTATNDPCACRGAGVRGRHLLQVIDVLDLGVRPDPVVVTAEVRLTICEEDRLVLGMSYRGDGEIPPLREEERGEEDDDRDRDVAK
jgi:hypothetical protein